MASEEPFKLGKKKKHWAVIVLIVITSFITAITSFMVGVDRGRQAEREQKSITASTASGVPDHDRRNHSKEVR